METPSEANNYFSIELYANLKQLDKNLIFSPFSIFTALAMVYAGARGSTEAEIKRAMHITLNQNEFHLTLKELMEKLLKPYKSNELDINNTISVKSGYEIQQEYISIIQNNYKVKISYIPSPIHKDTVLTIINEIYFKLKWDLKFNKSLTKDNTFTLISGKEVKVPMMHQQNKFDYFEDDDLQVLLMNYKDKRASIPFDRISMIIFLPKKKDGLDDLESTLTLEKIHKPIEHLQKQMIKVFIPRFKIETEDIINQSISQLGIKTAFTMLADFSGIGDKPSPFIDKIIHKAFIDVDEEGTEAYAATRMKMLFTGILKPPPEIPIFRADHPFLFLLRDWRTKTILFMGKVMNPKEK